MCLAKPSQISLCNAQLDVPKPPAISMCVTCKARNQSVHMDVSRPSNQRAEHSLNLFFFTQSYFSRLSVSLAACDVNLKDGERFNYNLPFFLPHDARKIRLQMFREDQLTGRRWHAICRDRINFFKNIKKISVIKNYLILLLNSIQMLILKSPYIA